MIPHLIVSVLALCGCCNMLPQTGWLKTTEKYPLPGVGATSLKSVISVGLLLFGDSQKEFVPCHSAGFQRLLAIFGTLWLTDRSFQSLPLSSHGFSMVFHSISQISLSFLLQGHQSSEFGPTLNLGGSHLQIFDLITPAKIAFPNKIIGTDPGGQGPIQWALLALLSLYPTHVYFSA